MIDGEGTGVPGGPGLVCSSWMVAWRSCPGDGQVRKGFWVTCIGPVTKAIVEDVSMKERKQVGEARPGSESYGEPTGNGW